MKIAVIGTGHVGLVTAATLAKIGHEVVGFDDDRAKIDLLVAGKIPFYEPSLQELLIELNEKAISRLRFTNDPREALSGVEVAFICVGTPSKPDGDANLLALERAAQTVANHATRDMVIVEKSTVPVRTADRIKKMLSVNSSHTFLLVSNPEFLRQGQAVTDSLRPDRILVGAEDDESHSIMRRLYAPLISKSVAYHATDTRTAELAKHACNAFLALKISFANALARICEAAGADVTAIADIMGSDPRIGRAFLNAGLGYGGYCLPKDLAAFRAQSAQLGYDFRMLDEIATINEHSIEVTLAKIKDALWNLEGKHIVLLGLSYKPGTDDVRDSPALRLASRLLDAGARVVGYDPQANKNARNVVPKLEVSDDPYAAADGAHCLVVCTEWPEFAELDLVRLKGILTHPIVVDGRNLFDPSVMAEAGFTYISTGRPAINL